MKLSIVMMIKDEEKYLENTLKSLKTLMQNIESELIILDTGSKDNSINIARKYTDKIFFDEWDNNFANMRNRSISYASGDWVLILDADEKLINCEKMIEFFRENEYKKFNSASIDLKNIHSEYEELYTNISIPRLFKRDKNLKYKGAIHEQPNYKEPLYNDIANFEHYGYINTDEELRQRKFIRNRDILISEINRGINSDYNYYQLAKSYTANYSVQDALYCMEKSFELYKNKGKNPIMVQVGLVNLYNITKRYYEAEKLCLKYIEKDDKNIDIYYHLAFCQNEIGKHRESLNNYNRYLYLLDNYNVSTQANSLFCDCNTISFREKVKVEIIKIYYKLKQYKKVEIEYNNLEQHHKKQLYGEVFVSLYKLNKYSDIINLYECKLNTLIEKKYFENKVEEYILSLKENDKYEIYKILSKLKGNYGELNKVRQNKKVDKKEIRNILKEEKEAYYGEVIYYYLKHHNDLENVLKDISSVDISRFIKYNLENKKSISNYFYNYLIYLPNTLEIDTLRIYSYIIKEMLEYSDLKLDKYRNLFMMYVTYRYEYIKQIYNNKLSDEKLIRFVGNDDDIFVIKYNQLIYEKIDDQLEFIRKIKLLVIEFPQYRKGLMVLNDKINKDLKESIELKKLKRQYKDIIKNNIEIGNIEITRKLLNEYEEMFKSDDIYNLKAIINIYSNNIDEAEKLLKLAYCSNINDIDTIYNIAYLKELKNEKDNSFKFYNKILNVTNDENLKYEIKEKLSKMF